MARPDPPPVFILSSQMPIDFIGVFGSNLILVGLDFPTKPLCQNPASATLYISVLLFYYKSLYWGGGGWGEALVTHYKFAYAKYILGTSTK